MANDVPARANRHFSGRHSLLIAVVDRRFAAAERALAAAMHAEAQQELLGEITRGALQRLVADKTFDQKTDEHRRQHAGARLRILAADPLADRTHEALLHRHVQ